MSEVNKLPTLDQTELSRDSTSELDKGDHITREELDEFGTKIDTTIPDGGWMAWLQVLGAWTSIIMTFGMSSGNGVMMTCLEQNYLQDSSPSRVGWMFSVQLFLFYFMGVVLGPVVDAYGARILTIPGSIGWVAAIFILSACKEYYQFVLCYSILGGFSSSLLFNPSVTVLTHWFSKHRGLAIGIAASGSGVGGIIFTQMFQILVDKVGFGWAVRAMAFVVLFCAIVTCLTLRTRHVHKSLNWQESKPELTALKEPSFLFAVIGLFSWSGVFLCPCNLLLVMQLKMVFREHSAVISYLTCQLLLL